MKRVLDGRELRDFIKERQAHQVRGLIQHFKSQPKLAIIQTKNDSVTNIYTRLKQEYGNDIRVVVNIYRVQQTEVKSLIEQLNTDDSVKGIVLQLPLANPSQTDELVNLIVPQKDVDGLGIQAKWDSATAMAINWLLAGYNIDLSGKQLAIVGQGRLVGKSLTQMWRNSGLEVLTLDNSCADLRAVLIGKDVIVTATGVPGLIKSDMLKHGAVVVDAGTVDSDGQILGDLEPDVRDRADIVATPAKGGVGPLTIAALMDNVIRASY
ncbi:MAG: bifunctional 5,10-methylenetetrahydrofolate dehydrogenase/5,10-methenyltetrahydrofolate cyclohydrolase [Candidatus Saccharibacteria bacterium]|nr:bifunctional 5,10-methylenetetrahydrofolate dehydrogenase/5,10-methenyltetrahydrofolate cyclohydrolase [Candidatus Saccharibacteria bacterium]